MSEEREFAVKHFKCDSCGFTAAHKTWKFPFLPYGIDGSKTIELEEGIKIYWENGELIIDSLDEDNKWALCSVYVERENFYWICRPFAFEAKDPADTEFMREISSCC